MEGDDGVEMIDDAQEEQDMTAKNDERQKKKGKSKKGDANQDDDSVLQLDEYTESQDISLDSKLQDVTLCKIVPPQAIRQRHDYEAFSNVEFPTVGKTIDIDDLKTADNVNVEDIDMAVKNLYQRMVDSEKDTQGQPFQQK